MTDAYLHAKLHFDPSNCLATLHQRYRQTGQTARTDRQTVQTDNGLIAYRANRFTNGRPKIIKSIKISQSYDHKLPRFLLITVYKFTITFFIYFT